MIVGIPMEIRANEYRVGAIPMLVEEMVARGHEVLVETKAGEASGYPDEAYTAVGASIAPSQEKLYAQAEFIIKVRAPRPFEYELIKPSHTLLCYFHYLSNLEMSRSLVGRGCTCYAFEFVSSNDNINPLLDIERILSARIGVEKGMQYLHRNVDGKGMLFGDVPGADPARVAIIGENAAAIHAARYAARYGAAVQLYFISEPELAKRQHLLPESVSTQPYDEEGLAAAATGFDVMIAATQTNAGVKRATIAADVVLQLAPGSVVVDLDIGAGGSFATSQRTDHQNPVFQTDNGVIHYCVPNLPGIIPVSASQALSHALLPYIIRFADMGFLDTLRADPHAATGLIIFEGRVTRPTLADDLDLTFYDFRELGDTA